MRILAVNEYITEIDLFSMLSKRLTLGALALPLLSATWCGGVRAAELGEVKVNSFLGQQLSADIELVDLTPADLAEIQAKLANPDVFKGAGLSVSPVLGGLYISIAKRDNRRFLHLTTLQPVNVEGLHLFLELSSGGRQIIRAATLWLPPEPPVQRAARTAAAAVTTPAAAPLPALVPTPAPAASAKVESSGQGEAGLSAAAERAFAARNPTAASAPIVPEAAVATSKAVLTPAKPAPAPLPARAEPPKPRQVKSDAAPPVAAPVQACVPAQVEEQIQQCQAMTGKLVDLEGKVQRMQQALSAPPAPAGVPQAANATSAASGASAPAAASAVVSIDAASAAHVASAASAPAKPAAAPAKPEPAPSKPGAKPSKPGASPEQEAKSRSKWIAVAIGSLAGLSAIGGLVLFLRRRKGQGPLQIWQSFRKKEEPAAVEPSVEEVTAQE